MKKTNIFIILILALSVFFINNDVVNAATFGDLEAKYKAEQTTCISSCGSSGTNASSCVEACGKTYESKVNGITLNDLYEYDRNTCKATCEKDGVTSTIGQCVEACDKTYQYNKETITSKDQYTYERDKCQYNCGKSGDSNTINSCVESCGKDYQNKMDKLNPSKYTDDDDSGSSDSGEAIIENLEICGGDTIYIFQIAILAIRFLQVLVPFALIIWGSLDFFKAMIAGDEKAMRDKRKPFITRLIAAILVILLPMIVNLIIHTIAKNEESTGEFVYCWVEAEKKSTIEIPFLDKPEE